MSQGTAKRVAPTSLLVASRQRRLISGDRLFRAIAYVAAALIIVVAVIFVIALFIPALRAIMKFGLGFFVSRTWDPVRAQFGALPAIYGTLVTSAIALVIAFPIGMRGALFLAADAGMSLLRGPLSFAIDVVAGIPSAVIVFLTFF